MFQLEEIPVPQPSEGEVLIRIQAMGVNPVDLKIRSGEFTRFHPALPAILGRDASGEISAIGSGVTAFQKGDAVLGMLDYDRGAYAEFVVASSRELAPKPDFLSHKQAAAIPVAALTAWQALFEHGKLLPRQSVLIHGASGGVGHFAVQFAAAHGALVAATCRGEDTASWLQHSRSSWSRHL